MGVDTDAQRGTKLRREHQEEPRRHDVLWFADGNVVLATDKYLFKVYKGLLSMHSSVFKDMFELPNVGESSDGQSDGVLVQEMYEGVPLVTLVGDKGEDVACLLRALFEHQYVFITQLYGLYQLSSEATTIVTMPIPPSTSSLLS